MVRKRGGEERGRDNEKGIQGTDFFFVLFFADVKVVEGKIDNIEVKERKVDKGGEPDKKAADLLKTFSEGFLLFLPSFSLFLSFIASFFF